MKKENKVVVFVKEHKRDIAIVAGTIAVIVGGKIVRNVVCGTMFKNLDLKYDHHEFDAAYEKIWGRGKGDVVGRTFMIPVEELGKFGEKLMTFGGINSTDKVNLAWGYGKGITE